MKVKTLEPIEHDGKKIKPGSFIEVDEAAGRQLVEARAAEAVGKGKTAAAPQPRDDAADPEATGETGATGTSGDEAEQQK